MTSTTPPLRVTTLSKSPILQKLERERSSVSNLPVKQQKQRINQLKHELEVSLRELAAPAVAQVLGKALELALAGDTKMIALILELHMSKPQAQEDSTGGRNAINIQINNLTNKKKPVEVIDVTSESDAPGNDGHSEEHPEVNPTGA